MHQESEQERIIAETAQQYAPNVDQVHKRASERHRNERSEYGALRKARNAERACQRSSTEKSGICPPELEKPVGSENMELTNETHQVPKVEGMQEV